MPPKGDPTRPLYLAIRSTRILGIFFLLIGVLATVPMLLGGMRARGSPGWFIMTGAVCYVLPGVAYLLCSIFLGRRQTWAVIVGIVLGALHALMTLIVAIVAAFGIATGSGNSGIGTVVWVVLLVFAFVLLALGQMIYHLSRSFAAIQILQAPERRGFEPLQVMPVIDTTADRPQ